MAIGLGQVLHPRHSQGQSHEQTDHPQAEPESQERLIHRVGLFPAPRQLTRPRSSRRALPLGGLVGDLLQIGDERLHLLLAVLVRFGAKDRGWVNSGRDPQRER